MSTSSPRLARPSADIAELKTTAYEKASVGLTAVLLLLGGITLLMFLIWLSAQFVWDRPAAVVGMNPMGGGGRGENLANQLVMEVPGTEEVPEVTALSTEPSLDSIRQVVASLDAVGGKGALGDGDGTDRGDDSGRDEMRGIIDAGRWEIRFSASDLDLYKRQLDFFGVEFGVAGGGIKTVDYVKDFTKAQPTLRLGRPSSEERRLRFLYKDGPLKQADRRLASEAGINIDGRIVFQFYNQQMYDTLLRLENEKMKPRTINEVVRTVFGIRPAGNGFEFYVIRQDYRAGSAAALP